jgi:hypothetical protein
MVSFTLLVLYPELPAEHRAERASVSVWLLGRSEKYCTACNGRQVVQVVAIALLTPPVCSIIIAINFNQLHCV